MVMTTRVLQHALLNGISPGARRDGADAVGYRRVSKGEQGADWKASLRQQTEGILALATRLGRTLPPDMIFEDRFSGEDAESRPAFMQMVEYCMHHPRPAAHPGYVLVSHSSRWGRWNNPEEAAFWRVMLGKWHWHVQYAQNDEAADPTVRTLTRAIGDSSASQYLKEIKQNAKRGARGAAAQGHWLNTAPFGYRRLAKSYHGRPDRLLEEGERKADDCYCVLTLGPAEEVNAVRFMFEEYVNGRYSLEALAREMRRRFPGRRRWCKQTVRQKLMNKTYLGMIIWGRRPADKHERAVTPVRPASEWVVKENTHPAIIEPAIFVAAQARLAANQRARRLTAGGYALTGLIHCAVCGQPYIGGGGVRGPAHDPDRYRFYKCASAIHPEVECAGRLGTLQRRIIEPLVINAVGEVVSSPVVRQRLRTTLDRMLTSAGREGKKHRRALERQRDEIARRLARVKDAYEAGAYSLVEMQEQKHKHEADLVKIDTALEQLDTPAPDVERARKAERDRILSLAANFPEVARRLRGNGHAIKQLLAPWIESATVDKSDTATRQLVLRIRTIPGDSSFFLSSSLPVRD